MKCYYCNFCDVLSSLLVFYPCFVLWFPSCWQILKSISFIWKLSVAQMSVWQTPGVTHFRTLLLITLRLRAARNIAACIKTVGNVLDGFINYLLRHSWNRKCKRCKYTYWYQAIAICVSSPPWCYKILLLFYNSWYVIGLVPLKTPQQPTSCKCRQTSTSQNIFYAGRSDKLSINEHRRLAKALTCGLNAFTDEPDTLCSYIRF